MNNVEKSDYYVSSNGKLYKTFAFNGYSRPVLCEVVGLQFEDYFILKQIK